ncbi:MAG: type II secretion system F family protein [Nanoarchaeota archaeon]|nr:type II secretion system F family protein [Nanoarchaeota archaeon]
MNLLIEFGKLLTRGKVKKVKEMLTYADIKVNPFYFVSVNFLLGVIITTIAGLIVFNTYGAFYALISAALTVFIYYASVLMILSLLAEQRARYVEMMLPDVLLLMASNLRSGISPEEAFLLSARPEFGFLADKIKKAGKKIAAGASLVDAFSELSYGIDSKLFKQTMNLIIEGINSGGDLSVLLESTANDIKETASIRKEVRSMIFVYAFFIFIAACLIAPVLYAVSIQLAEVLSKLSHSIAVQFVTEKTPTVKIVPSSISGEFLTNFAYINLTIVSVFASFIVALINKGNEKYGVKYIPFFLGIALALFYIARLVLSAFFGGIRVV